jgi:hypothetical protein
MNTTTTQNTQNKAQSSTFNSIALFIVAVMGIILMAFYLMAEIDEPEYLLYFAPILGLLFYGSYYIINHKIDPQFLNRAYPHDSQES